MNKRASKITLRLSILRTVSAGNEQTDEQDRGSADVPLYSGAPITVGVSMLLIITFAIRHSRSPVRRENCSKCNLPCHKHHSFVHLGGL